jgi:hypothetical protein
MRRRAAFVLTALVLASGCEAIGVRDRGYLASLDFGAPREIRVCILKAPRVQDTRARQLIRAMADEMAPFGIDVAVPWVRPWQRPGFTEAPILRDVAARELEPPCDRLIALVDRHAGDALWGLLLLPEIVGSVETATMTRGYVVANRATMTQWWTPPTSVARHEFYHLLGCPHAASRRLCYRRVAALKRIAGDAEFFPSMTLDGRVLLTRGEANERISGGAADP